MAHTRLDENVDAWQLLLDLSKTRGFQVRLERPGKPKYRLNAIRHTRIIESIDHDGDFDDLARLLLRAAMKNASLLDSP